MEEKYFQSGKLYDKELNTLILSFIPADETIKGAIADGDNKLIIKTFPKISENMRLHLLDLAVNTGKMGVVSLVIKLLKEKDPLNTGALIRISLETAIKNHFNEIALLLMDNCRPNFREVYIYCVFAKNEELIEYLGREGLMPDVGYIADMNELYDNDLFEDDSL
jgi:hypothetical protein